MVKDTQFYGNKAYLALGKLLVRQRPEIAEELLPFCDVETNETDMQKMPAFFLRFQSSAPSVAYAKEHGTKNQRNLFIAVILKLYACQVFSHPPASPVMKYGLVKGICDTLGMKKANTSIQIRQVLFDYKHYQDFRELIDKIAAELKQNQNQSEINNA